MKFRKIKLGGSLPSLYDSNFITEIGDGCHQSLESSYYNGASTRNTTQAMIGGESSIISRGNRHAESLQLRQSDFYQRAEEKIRS